MPAADVDVFAVGAPPDEATAGCAATFAGPVGRPMRVQPLS